MNFNIKTENELDIENMFKSFMNQVITLSICVFDRSKKLFKNKFL
jgi:hypothetical protein